MRRWQFLIDRGGTFTDLVGIEPGTGRRRVTKVLSSDDAPLIGIRQLLGLDADAPIPPCDVRLGTTLATNALLERRGVPCALAITRGFGDLLDIGTQARPDLFRLDIDKPSRLHRHVIELDARLDRDGGVLQRPEPEATREALRVARASGCRSLAIAVLHAYANPELELELEAWARDAGFEHVVCSHELASQVGLLRRTDTAVLDAYLTPLLGDYLRGLARQLPHSRLQVMQSSGELASPEQLRGPAALLSGPAAGVVAVAKLAEAAGHASVIGFDMGGTSTDVCRVAGTLPRRYESTIAGVRVLYPMMDIHTVAAGGGSICRFDGHALSVGPESAGARPGPACYGAGGQEPCLTDVNLLLGRLQPDHFPFPLDRAAALRAIEKLLDQVHTRYPAMTRDELLAGLSRIADDGMARAIQQVSLARGHDVREDVLLVFGGAGGQHACAVAAQLGIRTVLFPPHGGVLSALGMGWAHRGTHEVEALAQMELTPEALADAVQRFLRLEARCAERLLDPNAPDALRFTHELDLCYRGAESVLTLLAAPHAELLARFEAEHMRLFGYARPDHPIELVNARVLAVEVGTPLVLEAPDHDDAVDLLPAPHGTARIHFDRWIDAVPVLQREDLVPGESLDGPLCVLETTGTLLIPPGFRLTPEPDGMLRVIVSEPLEHSPPSTARDPHSEPVAADPVALEIMGNAFMSIAEQMGAVLQRTALSTNIRERLDFSCALFDAHAQLIANAPHIPVHLGAMSESVADIARRFPEPRPGDVFISNDPASGGSHLPDITLVTPVFDRGVLRFYTASRGHHADVGGITPGSMPPFSTTLEEEGIVLSGLRIVEGGRFDRETLLERLTRGRYPARYPEQNLADVEAQIAANHLGARLLGELMDQHGANFVERMADHLQDSAAAKVRDLCRELGSGSYSFRDQLDDGTPLAVNIEVQPTGLRIRFAETPEHPGNANAPRAVTVAAVLYALRCLLGRGLPLNGGCLRGVSIEIPSGSLLNPSPERAVSSGNVETAQRIVDVLLGALGVAAASQGTMNNLTFGNEAFAYYETLGGGAGAGPSFVGASAVQVHMTNTRITDPEVLERKYPVRLRHFGIRRGSGGAGRHRGGDGLIREFEFLAPLDVCLISERRTIPPYGLAGGAAGLPGRDSLNGDPLPGRHQFRAATGTRLRIETPGGGGYGVPDSGADGAAGSLGA